MRINGGSEVVKISKSIRVTGTSAIAANVLQLTGTVRITDQYATITSVTTLNNATGIYATAYDGTNSENLTSNGAVLSGAPVGSFFTKDRETSQIYSVSLADEVRVNEVLQQNQAGKPFTVTQKNGADTFIRFHLTTTDTPVDFTVTIVFKYVPLSPGSNLVFL